MPASGCTFREGVHASSRAVAEAGGRGEAAVPAARLARSGTVAGRRAGRALASGTDGLHQRGDDVAPRIHQSSGLLLALCAISAAASAGCRKDSARAISGEKLQAQIRADLESQTGMVLTSVECPGSRPVRKGDAFTCLVRLGADVTMTVSALQVDDRGTVRTEVTDWKGITNPWRVATQIGHWLEQQTKQQARVDCGAGFRRTREARLYTCTATFPDGSTVLVDVTGGGDETEIRWQARAAGDAPPPAP